VTELAIVTIALPLVAAAGVAACAPRRAAAALNVAGALASGAAALALSVVALVRAGEPLSTRAFRVDAASGVFLAAIAAVGVLSALGSPAHLAASPRSAIRSAGTHARYYAAFYVFWALLLAIPLAGNLGVAWLLIEATTAASALLVAHSGRRSALEASWKYLVLTTAGLTVALLGIVIVFVSAQPLGGRFATLDWVHLPQAAAAMPRGTATVALALVLTGLATKVGWAPVHSWLPDAHSEAPPPVSALLSAALLPTVMLVAWRLKDAFDPVLGDRTARTLFLGFGLASLAVAVPFLWRPLAWKRLLAYSSLEHMGVLALGIGFGHPVAIAGVVLHVAGHGLAKALGFHAATPLLRLQPSAAVRPPAGLAAVSRSTAGAVGLSLASLSGLPPSPLFFSELFVLLGGILAGQLWVSAVAGVLLALGFLGLGHTLIEGLAGRPRRLGERPEARPLAALVAVVAAGLAALTASAYFLPGSTIVEMIARWPR
jgi:hydrogenase-4 component F